MLSGMFRSGGSGHRRVLRVGKWMGLIAFAVVGVVGAVRLGRENLWSAPAVLALAVLCMASITRLVGKTVRGTRRRRFGIRGRENHSRNAQ